MYSRASDSIWSAEFLYEEEQVGVKFLKPLPVFKIGDLQFGPCVEGALLRMPLWAARLLESEGILTIQPEEGEQLNPGELSKLSWKEERNEALALLPPNFYPKLRNLLTSLNDGMKKNPTHATLSEQRQAFMKAKDLINCRLQKILRLSFERNPPKQVLDSLQPEERSLFGVLRLEVESWRERILSEKAE